MILFLITPELKYMNFIPDYFSLIESNILLLTCYSLYSFSSYWKIQFQVDTNLDLVHFFSVLYQYVITEGLRDTCFYILPYFLMITIQEIDGTCVVCNETDGTCSCIEFRKCTHDQQYFFIFTLSSMTTICFITLSYEGQQKCRQHTNENKYAVYLHRRGWSEFIHL